MAVVVNKSKDKFDVYIGRGSQWGNPFVIGQDGNRSEVIAKYRVHLWGRIRAYQSGRDVIVALAALDGKRLGCFCKPLPCHGDVLVAASAWAVAELAK